MRAFIRAARVLMLAGTMASATRLAAAQQETPVNPDSLSSESTRNFALQLNGFAAGQYRYRLFSEENDFGGSALALSIFKAFSDRVSFFGQVTVRQEESSAFREDAESAPAKRCPFRPQHAGEENASNSFQTELDNLQVAWTVSSRRGLSVILGKFDSPLAIERDDAPLRFQATSSFVFQFARPIKFTGVMARETFSPKFEGYAILANGWDLSRDNNRAKTAAIYAVWSPWPVGHFGMGIIHGAEKDGRTGDPRTTGVATILVQQTDSWVWGEEFVYGREPHSAPNGATARWFGDMFFTHHRLGPRWAVTLRTDYFDDVDGSRTGRRQIVRSFTISPQYLVGGGFFGVYRTLDRTSLRIPELAARLDLRWDRSTEKVFDGRGEGARKDSPSATLQIIYVF